MYKPLTQNIRARCLVWYFDPRIIPGTSHKLRSFWTGPYWMMKLIAPALAEIKLVYYTGEERLESLDVLKMYCGEDVIRQNPEDWSGSMIRQKRVDGTTGDTYKGSKGRERTTRGPERARVISLKIQKLKETEYTREFSPRSNTKTRRRRLRWKKCSTRMEWSPWSDDARPRWYDDHVSSHQAKRDEVVWGWRKQRKEDDIPRRNVNILPWYLGEHETKQDSIERIGLSFNKEKMNCRGFHRWCFMADVWR